MMQTFFGHAHFQADVDQLHSMVVCFARMIQVQCLPCTPLSQHVIQATGHIADMCHKSANNCLKIHLFRPSSPGCITGVTTIGITNIAIFAPIVVVFAFVIVARVLLCVGLTLKCSPPLCVH